MKTLKVFGSIACTCLALGISGCATHYHEYPTDHSINSHVQDSLAHSYGYNYPNVSVHTRNGVVQLDGYVETPQEQANAEQLAASTPGVRQVVDNLKVTAPLPPAGRAPIIRQNYP
jgi:osmotically-inducible protein OsmY